MSCSDGETPTTPSRELVLAWHQHSGHLQGTNNWLHYYNVCICSILLYSCPDVTSKYPNSLSGAAAGGDHHATTLKASPRVGRKSPRITRSTTPVDVLLLQKDDLVYVVHFYPFMNASRTFLIVLLRLQKDGLVYAGHSSRRARMTHCAVMQSLSLMFSILFCRKKDL